MSAIRFIFFLTATLFCSEFIEAQSVPYVHEYFSIENGLSSNEVLCGLQDKRGYLWFGTGNGLNRYDGIDFHQISPQGGFQGKRIVSLVEDHSGLIWISYGLSENTWYANGTIDIYNPITGTVETIQERVDYPPANIAFLIPNGNGEIYLVTHDKLIFQLVNGDHFKQVFKDDAMLAQLNLRLPNVSIKVYNEKLLLFNPHESKLSHFTKDGDIEYISTNQTKNDAFQLLLTKQSLTQEENVQILKTDAATHKTIDELRYIKLNPNSNQILLEHDIGIYLFDENKVHLLYPTRQNNFWQGANVEYFSDKQGNHWMCTLEGLHKFTPQRNKFDVLFQKGTFQKELFLTNQIRAIDSDSLGNIISSGEHAILFYNTESQQYSKNASTEIFDFAHTETMNYAFGRGIKSFASASIKQHGKIPEFTRKEFNIDKDSSGYIWVGHIISEEEFVLGTTSGLFHFNTNTKEVSKIISCAGRKAIKGIVYNIIFSEKDQLYWVVSSTGLYSMSTDLCVVDKSTQSGQLNDPHSLLRTELRDIYEDDEGILWMTSNGEGLFRWDRTTDEIQTFKTKEGLPSNILYCILSDDYGNLWISTNNGLAQFDVSSFTFNNFQVKDGISHNEFNRVSKYKDEHGRMYFGSVNGLTAFHPKDFIRDSMAWIPPLQVTSVHQFVKSQDKLIDKTIEVINQNSIVLNPGDNFFHIKYALLDMNEKKRKYRYRINGLDDQWIHTDEGSVQFGGLPYGDYTIELAGFNYANGWSDKTLSIPIDVRRPFYLLWWAYVLYGVGFISFLYFLRRYQYKRALEHADKKRLLDLDELKSKLYTNITHEFRTPLTVIMGMANQIVLDKQSLSTLDEKNEIERKTKLDKIENRTAFILRNANNLLQLVNQMLDLSKIDEAKLNIDWRLENIIPLLDYIVETFEAFAQTSNLNFVVSSDVEFLEMDHDVNKVQKILANLLSNAIKFTPEGGTINCTISKIVGDAIHKDGYLQVGVSNTGPGISPDNLSKIFDRFYQIDDSLTRTHEGTGIGLSLSKELVDLMGGSITVTSELEKTTEFTVLFPIHRNASSQQSNSAIIGLPEQLGEHQWSQAISTSPAIDEDMPLLLLIEDNKDVAAYVRLCVQDLYTVIYAKNGKVGIDMAIEHVPDIIISDVMMPIKNGYEVCQHLKTDERTSHIPIILLTAKTSTDSRVEGIERGADAYLTKPFVKKELRIRLQKMIELRQKLQTYYASDRPFFRAEQVEDEEILVHEGINLQLEDTFLQKIHFILDREMSNANFEIPKLSKELGVSHSQLYRKVKALTGKSIVGYLRSYRLQKARHLLNTTTKNVSEVAYDIGFTDPLYFSRIYSQTFGHPPTEKRDIQKLP